MMLAAVAVQHDGRVQHHLLRRIAAAHHGVQQLPILDTNGQGFGAFPHRADTAPRINPIVKLFQTRDTRTTRFNP